MLPEQLIDEIKSENKVAQKALFKLYYTQMYLLCLRYVKNKEDAEERVIDGFCDFFKSIQKFEYKDKASLFKWLSRIMVNGCLMQLRKHSFLTLPVETASEIPTYSEPDIDLTLTTLTRIIHELPMGYRTVFNMYEIENYSHREIAETLKISEATSRSQLANAKKLLQKLIQHQNVTHERTAF